MSDADLTVREACRQRIPIDGTDAQALEHALTITERERDEALCKLKSAIVIDPKAKIVPLPPDSADADAKQLRRWAGTECKRKALDAEIGRWQQAIYEACCKAVDGLREAVTIDGAGCDSGDPLDLTLTEIGQAVNALRDEIDELMREKAVIDQQVEKWRSLAEKRARERDIVESENVRLEGERARSRTGIVQLRKERDIARTEIKSLRAHPRTPYLDGDKR